MKILTKKIPVKLTRTPSGVEMEMFEDRAVEDFSIPISQDEEARGIVMLSKDVGDFNDKQRIIVKKSLFANETTRETHILLRYLA